MFAPRAARDFGNFSEKTDGCLSMTIARNLFVISLLSNRAATFAKPVLGLLDDGYLSRWKVADGFCRTTFL